MGDVGAAAGVEAYIDSAAAWATHSVEQDAVTSTVVSMGTTGATTGVYPMTGTGTKGSARPADARTSSAVSELAVKDVVKQARVLSIDR
jgi:hypothetical protein